MRLLLKELCNIFFRNFRLVLLTNSNSLHYDSQLFLSTYRGGGGGGGGHDLLGQVVGANMHTGPKSKISVL